MKVDIVSCIVGIRQQPEDEGYDLQVIKTGGQAIRVTEIGILQDMNGMDSVTNIKKVGEIEVNKADEHRRLMTVYKTQNVNRVYPSPATPMPRTVEDLDVDHSQLAKVEAPKEERDEAYDIRQQLKSMGVDVHPRTGLPKLQAMLADVNQVGA